MPPRRELTPEAKARKAEAYKRWYAGGKGKDWQKRYTADRPWLVLYAAAQGRAKKSGVEFTITAEEVRLLTEPMVCEATGLPLRIKYGDVKTWANPWAPSLDRRNPTKGYVPGNVRVVCWLYNSAKNQWTDEDVLKMARALAERNET